MYIINIALKRADGKVECDTVYRDTFFTPEEAQNIADNYACEVIVQNLGRIKYHEEEPFICKPSEVKEVFNVKK